MDNVRKEVGFMANGFKVIPGVTVNVVCRAWLEFTHKKK
jgi:hypothetical protein